MACWGSVSRQRLLRDSGFQASRGPAAAQVSRLPHGRWGSRPGRGWSCWPPSGAAEVVAALKLQLLFTSHASLPSLSAQHTWCQLSVRTQLSPLGSRPGKLLRAIPNSECKDLTSRGQPSTSRADPSRPIPPAEAHPLGVLGDAEPQLCTVGIHSIVHFFFPAAL